MANIKQGTKPTDTTNKALQRSKVDSDFKSKNISIIDVDTAILQYLEEKNLTVSVNGQSKKVPIIYGSPERWKQAGRNGYIKDQKGQVQIPLIIFKRNSLGRRDDLVNRFNQNQRVTYTTAYSNKNRFDKFSQQIDLKPTKEVYKVRVGDFVQMDYEFIVWTEFISHTNELIEQLNWNSDEYWGVDGGPKFKSSIDSFSTENEVATDVDRLVRTTFTLSVKAYLLPELKDDGYDEQVLKSYTTQKTVIFDEIETELTKVTTPEELDELLREDRNFSEVNQIGALFPLGAFSNNATQEAKNNEFDEVLEFVSFFDTRTATVTSSNTAVFQNTTTKTAPNVDYLNFDNEDLYQIFINGIFIPPSIWSVNDDGTNITFTFNTNLLNYEIESIDEIRGIGKFIDA
jgi:hypothetical protein